MTKHSDCWMTPQELVDDVGDYLGLRFVLDVCADRRSAKAPHWWEPINDALQQDWTAAMDKIAAEMGSGAWNAAAWCNPPYSDPGEWIERCIELGLRYDVVALVPLSLAAWARRAMLSSHTVYLPPGRVRFIWPPWLPERATKADGARQDTCLIHWAPGRTGLPGVWAEEASWLRLRDYRSDRIRFSDTRPLRGEP